MASNSNRQTNRPILLLLALLLVPLSAPDLAWAAYRPVSIGVNTQQPPQHQLSRAANVGWVRVNIRWDQVNPSAGTWNFSGIDQEITAAQQNGQQILAILAWVPQWLGGGPERNIPPATTLEWEEYVRRTAQRYNGVVAAYEIWNEPTYKGGLGSGIGWNKDIHTPPLYIDFVRSAAQQIRTHAPGTLVVAPATGSRFNDRTRIIFEQIEGAQYPDGPGSSFIDVISFHANIHDGSGPRTASGYLADQLYTLELRNPSNKHKEIWITEFGWLVSYVGQTGQREYICKFLRTLTGAYRDSETPFERFNITRAFIYKLYDFPGQSDGIYDSTLAPRMVVQDYLWGLSYPATQFITTNDYDPPNCLGPFGGPGNECPPGQCPPEAQNPADGPTEAEEPGL